MVGATRSVVLAITLMLLGESAAAQSPTRDISVEAMRSEKRVALVIGNSAYPAGRLSNSALDARAMAQALRDLGFEVIAREDLDYQNMRRAVAAFGGRIANGGVGLFYYSGHGVSVNGRNYLVPVDAELKTERYVSVETVDVDSVLAEMQEARTRVNIVVLDACRNNPFASRFRSVTRGLAFMDAPTGTYVAYATAPGSVADDGEPGKNGVYTGELLRALREPGLRIEDVFKRVRIGVQQRTGFRQNPWDASSLTGDFFFNLTTASLAPTPTTAPPRIEIREEVGRGTLAVSSGVAGVDVWLGEQKIGTTRSGRTLIVSNLPTGTHKITARKEGHPVWEREVEIAANQRSDVIIDIAPLDYLRGTALLDAGRTAEGIAVLRSFTAASPDHPLAPAARKKMVEALVGAGRASGDRGPLTEAYQALMNEASPTASGLYDAGLIAGVLKRPADQEAAWRKLRREFPKDPLAHRATLELANGAFRRNDFKETAALATAASQSTDDPVRADALVLLGESELKLKRYAPALKAFTSSLETPGMESGLRYRALAGSAIAHEEQKQYTDALSLYEEVAKNSPDETLRNWAAKRAKVVKDRLRAAEKPTLTAPDKPAPTMPPPSRKN